MGSKFQPTRDWKEEVKGYCPCFSNSNNYLGCIAGTCPNRAGLLNYKTGCHAYHFKCCLLSAPTPKKSEFVLALLRMGCFTRKQLFIAIQEIYKARYSQAESAVESCLRNISHEKVKGFYIYTDDEHRYRLVER